MAVGKRRSASKLWTVGAAVAGLTVAGLTVAASSAASPALYLDSHASPSARAGDLVGRLSLDEQLGQLVQIQVGKLYGVHRATAARWLSDAREALGALIRAELAARLRIATEDVDSIVRLVQSRVDMSLDRLLVPEVSG